MVKIPGLAKKKAAATEEDKKDLTQNYTTEDHKVELHDLLQSLGTDAGKVRSCFIHLLPVDPFMLRMV